MRGRTRPSADLKRPSARAPELTLEPAAHIYRWRGRVVPGLHQVLTSLGIIQGHGTEADVARGHAVALATRFYDEQRLDGTTVDPRIEG